MDTLTAMQMFRRVVETGSFSAVARESGLSQPSVSKHVSALEKRLGIRLLNRNTRHQALTDIGREYYQHCVRILDDVDETESGLSSLPRYTVASPEYIEKYGVPGSPADLEHH